MKIIAYAFIIIVLGCVTSVNAQESKRGQFFALADQDKSASLNREEFRKFINLLAKSGHRNARRVRTFRLYSLAWARVDRDDDGYATIDELLKTRTAHNSQKKKPPRLSTKNTALLGPR